MFHVVFRILLLFIYLFVSCSGSITSVVDERANFSAIVYLQICGSVGRCFLFIHGIGYVVSLWHSVGLPYNYFLSIQRSRVIIHAPVVFNGLPHNLSFQLHNNTCITFKLP